MQPQHYHTLSHQQHAQLQIQQLQQQRGILDPTTATAAGHHLHLHHQQQLQQQQPPNAGIIGHVHPGQTMTINRKLHGVAGVGVAPLPQPPFHGDDNPPPLPPLRNPQKALAQLGTSAAGSEAGEVPLTTGTEKQMYIYSTAKYGMCGKSNGKHGHGVQQQSQQLQQQNQGHEKSIATGGNKNPNTTTFSATPASNSKPLPSIINCPLPDIPKAASVKDDIYVKRKLLSDLPNGGKFATLKPIPAPKIESGQLRKGGPALPNSPHTLLTDAQLPPPPPPPPPATASSSGSSGGSSSGYSTACLTSSQIQSLPLPPPPLELLQQQPQDTQARQQQPHQDQEQDRLRLPPPPLLTNVELAAGAPEQLNGDNLDDGAKGAPVGNDDNSFYAVTEL